MLVVSAFASFANSPPVAIPKVLNAIDAPPLYTSGDGGETVLASDGVQAVVIFDGSASYDSDNDPLQFVWGDIRRGDQGEYSFRLGEGVRTTNSFTVGGQMALWVSDGTTTTVRRFYLSVVSPTSLLGNMRNEVEDEANRGLARLLLLRKLDRAISRFNRGETRRGLETVARFRRALHRRPAGLDPARIEALERLSVLLLDSVRVE